MKKPYLIPLTIGLLILYKIVFIFFFSSLTQYRYSACFLGQILLVLPAIYCSSVFFASNIGDSLHRKISLWLSKCDQKLFIFLLGSIAFIVTFSIYSILFHSSSTRIDLDEIGYLFQSNNFAMGSLYSFAPPKNLQKFFDTYHVVIHQGKIFGKYPFGHSLILMLGILVGGVIIIPSLVAALNVILNYYIAKEIYDRSVAVCSSLLCLFCPFFLGYSSTLLSEGSSLFFLSLFLLFFLKFIKNPKKIMYPLLCGFFLGMKFNTKPITVISLSLPFIVYSFYLLLHRKGRNYMKGFIMITLSFGALFSLFFLYNYTLTGDPLLMPYNIYAPYDRPGFGPEMGGAVKEWGENQDGHCLSEGLRMAYVDISYLNQWMGWGFPISLVLVLTLFAKGRIGEWEWILFSTVISLIAILISYWGPSIRELGPVHYFDTILPLTLLSGRGINLSMKSGVEYKRRLMILFMIFTLIAGLYSLRVPIKKLYFLTSNYSKLKEEIHKKNIHRSLIFVQTDPNKPEGIPLVLYHNHPSFNNDIVYALDLGYEHNKELIKAYLDRNIYLWEKDSLQLMKYNFNLDYQ